MGMCADACPKGTMTCGQACPDLMTDPLHCGDCETACGPDQGCEMGECTCAGNTTSCDGVCVNTMNDDANCGGCGIDCGPDASCHQSECMCNNNMPDCELPDTATDTDTGGSSSGTAGTTGG
jgi:hypothetical protein